MRLQVLLWVPPLRVFGGFRFMYLASYLCGIVVIFCFEWSASNKIRNIINVVVPNQQKPTPINVFVHTNILYFLGI